MGKLEKMGKPERAGSGFQKLLQETSKSTGPRILKGLPIRQRAYAEEGLSKLAEDNKCSGPESSHDRTDAEAGEVNVYGTSPTDVAAVARQSEDVQTKSPDGTAGAGSEAEGHPDRARSRHNTLKAFWTNQESQSPSASLPRPRTPPRGEEGGGEAGDSGGLSAFEAGPSDRFGSPVLSLGVRSKDRGRANEYQRQQPHTSGHLKDTEKLWGGSSTPLSVSTAVSKLDDKDGAAGVNASSLGDKSPNALVQGMPGLSDRVDSLAANLPADAAHRADAGCHPGPASNISFSQQDSQPSSPIYHAGKQTSPKWKHVNAARAFSPDETHTTLPRAQVATSPESEQSRQTERQPAKLVPESEPAPGHQLPKEEATDDSSHPTAKGAQANGQRGEESVETPDAPARARKENEGQDENSTVHEDEVHGEVQLPNQHAVTGAGLRGGSGLGRGSDAAGSNDSRQIEPETARNAHSPEEGISPAGDPKYYHRAGEKAEERDEGASPLGKAQQAGSEAHRFENNEEMSASVSDEEDHVSSGEGSRRAVDALFKAGEDKHQSASETGIAPESSTLDRTSIASLDLDGDDGAKSFGETSDTDSHAAGSLTSAGPSADERSEHVSQGSPHGMPDLASLRSAPPGEISGRGSEHDPEWQRQPKHFFVLSNAGKPVFSLHGDGNKLAGFMGVIHAMISFTAQGGDPIRSFRAGRHLIVFLVKGPLYLVAASRQGEPEAVLRKQLASLHAQIVCILTTGFEQMILRNPRFDSRRLLGGTQGVLSALLHSFDVSPQSLVNAFSPLPLPSGLRQPCIQHLQKAVKASPALFGILLVGDLVCAIVQTKPHVLAQGDLLVLCNFLMSSESFLQAPESFTPVCLPIFNPAAFMHAYIHFLHKDARVCLALLSAQQDSFYDLAKAGRGLRKGLAKELKEIVDLAERRRGGARYHVRDLPASAGGRPPGDTPLLHFIYKSTLQGQHVAPAWTWPLDDDEFQKAVMVAYGRVHAAMQPPENSIKGRPAQRIRYEQTKTCTILGFVGAEFELYAAFDALVPKREALGICQRLSVWVKAQQATLFVPL